ncbi:Gfa-like protein [Novosphingobium sp. FSY-8]|uniref:Gfa-like protein n=1 Tax=Novosphingobium ovatum TaxID=1908523 RepID=A0ABW9XFV3_9SPHN|nr:GFA family protein [Novosphingobium ovatum]NBC37422.1 Gfa-like protein [Novosphingobium ovatum]
MIAAGKTYAGGCLCGDVRYALTGPSLFEQQCCCKDCQKATGTGHTTIIGVHQSQLAVTGTPATYTTHGESGGTVTRHFCGRCGGRLYTSGSLPGEVVMVQAGSLDDPDDVSPQAVIYLKQAVGWDHFDPAVPQFDHYAPMSQETLDAMVGKLPG